MKPTGVVRRLDELGRIVLPVEIRRTYNIADREPLEIYVDGDKIILKKYAMTDVFTGESDDLIEYLGKKISRKTIVELARIANIEVDIDL